MALGWVISEENFMKDNRFIDFLKLRFSYGANGNQAINRYQSLSRIATGFEAARRSALQRRRWEIPT